MLYQNFAYILEKKVDYYPNDIGVVEAHNGKSYRYIDLYHRANRLANALLDMGVTKGDRVLCLTRNTVEYFDIFFAVARMGAVVAPINYRLSPNEILRIVDDASPKAIIFDSMFKEKIKVIKDSRSDIKNFLVFGGNSCDWAGDYEPTTQKYPNEGPPIGAGAEDPILMLFTAGSTGRPKGVPLKHQNLFFKSVDCVVDVGITKQDYTLTVLPLFHIGGHMLWTLSHIHVGAKIMVATFEAETTLKLIEREKITNTYLLPAMLKLIIQIPGWEKYDLSSLRFVGAGGEPVPARVSEAFSKWSFPIFNSYGLTETADGTTFIRPEHVASKPAHCIGKTHTSVDAKVVDAQGNELEPGQEGEMIHRGPTLVDSYWQKPEESAKAFRDGWLYTGDRVVKDNDGFYYFLGRTDDMIISGGENIFPAEVEEVILAHPKVADVAILGVPDELWGQVVKAVIAPKEGMTVTEDEIIAHVKQHLASFKKPRLFEFVSDLPRMGSGKLDRQKIKETYAKPPQSE